MVKVRARGEDVRRFILKNVEKNASSIAGLTAKHFSITRQAVNKHLKNLKAEGVLSVEGNTRGRAYKLCALVKWHKSYKISPGLAEDVIWNKDVMQVLGQLPENVLDTWHFCFTEMFNNALDHSEGNRIFLRILKTAADTQMAIMDDGVGIFKKIQKAMNLADERHAILELSKGKLTTDPAKHTGQGIFFTSRLVDSFDLFGGGIYLSHVLGDDEDWIFERPESGQGTAVFLKVDNHTSRTCKKIFDEYSSEDDYGFVRTVVPVKLAQYGNDKLISRSQAKRVLARVEQFRTVVFNFEDVPIIGQAFADEIFRVFANSHPTIQLIAIKTNTAVKRMIESAKLENPTPLPTNLSLL